MMQYCHSKSPGMNSAPLRGIFSLFVGPCCVGVLCAQRRNAFPRARITDTLVLNGVVLSASRETSCQACWPASYQSQGIPCGSAQLLHVWPRQSPPILHVQGIRTSRHGPICTDCLTAIAQSYQRQTELSQTPAPFVLLLAQQHTPVRENRQL